jgi:hypothetical protein
LPREIINAHPRIAIESEMKATPLIIKTWLHLLGFKFNLEEHFQQEDINAATCDLVHFTSPKLSRKDV